MPRARYAHPFISISCSSLTLSSCCPTNIIQTLVRIILPYFLPFFHLCFCTLGIFCAALYESNFVFLELASLWKYSLSVFNFLHSWSKCSTFSRENKDLYLHLIMTSENFCVYYKTSFFDESEKDPVQMFHNFLN